VRVFGCEGPTDVTVDAIEWAVDNDMDVINMSLGSVFGSKTSRPRWRRPTPPRPGSSSLPRPATAARPVRHRLAGKRRRRHLGAANDPWQVYRREHHRRDSYGPAIDATAIVIRDYELHDQGSYRRQRARLQRRRLRRSELPAVGTIVVVNRGTLRAGREGDLRSEAGAAAVVMVNNGPASRRSRDRLPRTRTPAKLST